MSTKFDRGMGWVAGTFMLWVIAMTIVRVLVLASTLKPNYAISTELYVDITLIAVLSAFAVNNFAMALRKD